MRSLLVSLLSLYCLTLAVEAKTYKLSQSLSGQKLLNAFTWQTGQSDNGGVAMYNSQSSAKKKGLVSIAKNGAVKLGVSTKKYQNLRDSVRLVSKQTFSGGGLFVFDVNNIPAAQGAWPALWMTGSNWPQQGEIDVIEGVHETTMNALSTHTSSGCSMQDGGFYGTFMMQGPKKNDCDAHATNSQGCGVRSKSKISYGPAFNKKKGGVYALQWSSSGIRIYFWPRNSIPSDIKSGHPKPSSKWGTPHFLNPASSCNPFQRFSELMLVINTNLCGTWAAGTWGQSLSYAGQNKSPQSMTGHNSCESFVQNNGQAFKNAYWSINSIKIYK
ncbi:uncharacterized protein JCM6883_002623 [Sporobolomyces salmoneus]|uniref:uncharacterized protein n=1 Tax=Sporobolomyces salmoneus TaxID=183962 RepID=UPI0031772433